MPHSRHREPLKATRRSSERMESAGLLDGFVGLRFLAMTGDIFQRLASPSR
jgi:hypothetical protein